MLLWPTTGPELTKPKQRVPLGQSWLPLLGFGGTPSRQGGPAVNGSVRWEILEKIGAYAAGELSAEEARETQQFILEEPKAWCLANSYARLLALLGAIGEESLDPSEAIAEDAIHWAASGGRRVAGGPNEMKRRRTT